MSDTLPTTLFSAAAFKHWLKVTSNKTFSVSSLTSSGTIATASATAHGLLTGQDVDIAGAAVAGYNGIWTVTVLDANTFQYTLPEALGSTGGTITGTPDDGRIIQCADAASSEIERRTSRVFCIRTLSATLSGNGKYRQALPWRPIVSLDMFTINGQAQNPSSYVIDPNTGIVTFTAGCFAWGIMNVVVAAHVGFDVQDGPNLPQDIVRAGLDLGKAIFNVLTTGAIAASRVSMGPAGIFVRPADIPGDVERVIKTWRDTSIR